MPHAWHMRKRRVLSPRAAVWPPEKSAARQQALEGAGDVKSEAAERMLRQAAGVERQPIGMKVDLASVRNDATWQRRRGRRR